MDMKETVTATEYKFCGRIINLRVDAVDLPDGHHSHREIVEHGGGVGVLAVTDDKRVPLVRQYRHPYGEVIWEIPAGKLEPGEEPLICGNRELTEETGYTASDWRPLGEVYPSPGYCSEVISVFLATGLSSGEARPDDGELIETELFTLDDAVKMVMAGQIRDSKTQTALLKAALLDERGELI